MQRYPTATNASFRGSQFLDIGGRSTALRVEQLSTQTRLPGCSKAAGRVAIAFPVSLLRSGRSGSHAPGQVQSFGDERFRLG